MTAAHRLAAFAAALDPGEVPARAIQAAKLHLLDALGVGLAAASLETRPRIERAVLRMEGVGRGVGFKSEQRRFPSVHE